MAFGIEFMPTAWEHLKRFSAHNQGILLDAIEQQLHHQPDQKTRHRKPLRPNSLADWELRVGNLFFYEILSKQNVVNVIAIY
jgi:mRNA-degrading endonuclease RelE of RelBE toxin-antitoxin system